MRWGRDVQQVSALGVSGAQNPLSLQLVALPGPRPWTAPSALPRLPRRGCDELWRAAVADLVENLDAEQPEDPAAAPRVG